MNLRLCAVDFATRARYRKMLAIGCLLACGTNVACHDSRTDSRASVQTITVARSLSPLIAPFLIADEKQLWRRQHMEIVDRDFFSGRLALDAVLGGQAQLGTVAETPLVLAALGGQRFVIVSTFAATNTNIRCIGRADRHVLSPRDLRGRKIAVSLGTSQEFYLDEMLQANGLSRRDIIVVGVQPPDVVVPFVRGDVDAALSWEPLLSTMKNELGDKAILFAPDRLYHMTFDLVCLPSFAESDGGTLKKILLVLQQSMGFLKQSRAPSISIVAKRLSISEQVIRDSWLDYDFALSLSPSLIDTLDRQARWAKMRGLTPAVTPMPNFAEYIYAGPLREVDKEMVTIPTLSPSAK
jgi:NitT/TauT family transport system substrate-binding protein